MVGWWVGYYFVGWLVGWLIVVVVVSSGCYWLLVAVIYRGISNIPNE
jgi:hypothetical protein